LQGRILSLRGEATMRLEQLFSQYGYLMLLFGSLGEGSPIMLFGGFAAHRGWLELVPAVIAIGALGNAMAQTLWFLGARYAGQKVSHHHAVSAEKAARIGHWLKRWEALCVIGARFIPGFGSAVLIAVALSDITATRFTVLNIIGALLWATSFGVLGYLLGSAVVGLLGEIERYEKPVAVALLVATVIWIGWHQMPRILIAIRAPA
jgi:membrane protein DedA with SNARE-associated domain